MKSHTTQQPLSPLQLMRKGLSRQDIRLAGEIVPDSEEERRETVFFREVIEISSDDDSEAEEDPFRVNNFSSKIPGPSRQTKEKSSGKGSTSALRTITNTPRKLYRAPRKVIESSDSESEHESEHERRGEVRNSDPECPEVIELSDSSPERSTPKPVARKPLKVGYENLTPSEDDLFDSDSEDSAGDEDAILTLDEPRSARKPLRLPDASLPIKRLQDVVSTSPTLDPGPTPLEGAPSLQKKSGGSLNTLTPVSTPSIKARSKATPRVNKKAQAIAEQERREDYAQKLFEDLNRCVFENKLPKETKLNWSKRLLTTAGRAKWHRSREGINTTEIELAEKILDSDERIRNTLSHEMCHLASWIIDSSPKEVHGTVFKSWARKIMKARPEIEITTRHNYEIGYKFNWKCVKCAKIYGRHSKSIDINKVVCGACREGRLVALFETRASRMPKTPKTSKLAATKPQDSPQALPRISDGADTPLGPSVTDRVVYAIHDTDSEPEDELEELSTYLGRVTFSEAA